MMNPDGLGAADTVELMEIRTVCPHLDATARHVHDFAEMLQDLRGNQLPNWMDPVLADDLLALNSPISGLSAVTAGLSTPWSSG
ncbi:hypothetical protein ACFXD5_20015 [Streptomyces sp. NPDC059385]|uniref:hypothetical protein n=1 Tax=Streptomyces sp. NPDC059385 TaxID=3346817 RepID=UPI0036C2385B